MDRHAPPTSAAAWRRAWPWLVGALSLAWVVVLLAAPALAARAGGASARVGAAVYAFGGVICHQQAPRSFHVEGLQVPVCARCLGLYVGAPFGVALLLFGAGLRRWLTQAPRRALAAAAAPTALTVCLELAGWLADGNPARFAAALPLGAAVAGLVTTVGWVD